MTFVSFNFLAALLLAVIVYYILPKKIKWIVLLAGSILFYLQSGIETTLAVLAIGVFAYVMGIVIEKNEKGKKKSLLLALSVILLLGILAIVKVSNRIEILSSFVIVPVGISYFTLSIVGYLLEIYWGKEEAEKNVFHFLTFVYFFPKIIQGPISSYKYLGPQIKEGHEYNYDEICFGAQLIIWGMFKKIVLADRMQLMISEVYGDLDVYSQHGFIVAVTMILSAFQLYLDFSGYTDIAKGISQMFGIKLEDNFNRPFFAQSAAEFWQRWHMSLGSWFKDYLFLPVSRSSLVKKASKYMGSKFGPVARKKTMMVFSLVAVWTATALWHGTGINYLVWGVYWGGIIIFSEVFEGTMQKVNEKLKIKTASFGWRLFRILRTFAIFTVGKMISAQNSLYSVKQIIGSIIKRSHAADFELLFKSGMSEDDFIIVIIGLVILFTVSIIQEKGIEIRKKIAGLNPLVRWCFYALSITVVLLFGMYGAGYDTSTFAYAVF